MAITKMGIIENHDTILEKHARTLLFEIVVNNRNSYQQKFQQVAYE